MIISEATRRWVEIRFYYFCLDIFDLHHSFLDVDLAIQAIANLGNTKLKELNKSAGKMMGDPYYIPTEDELLVLANMHGRTYKEMAEYLGVDQRTVKRRLEKEQKKYNPYPRLSVNEDLAIKEFFETLDILKNAGV